MKRHGRKIHTQSKPTSFLSLKARLTDRTRELDHEPRSGRFKKIEFVGPLQSCFVGRELSHAR
jgi:hypothetical protein